jgi:pyruvate/2-oxoglutarate/acetoin dehydrogenase E1 component
MATTRVTLAEATRQAMEEEMERDPTVFLMGEDIAKQGGIFGQFKNLPDRFGLERVRDTPISESILVSACLGAAMTGTRPVLDIHFADFLAITMDEMANQIAKSRYMFGGQAQVPLVVRAPEGAINSAGAQHSQSLEAWFTHTPGLRVVSPSNPRDAKGLLKAAIRHADPVLYLEHKALYRMKGEVGGPDQVVPIGRAARVREGSDVTLVSWSKTLTVCLEASEVLAEEGIEAEVVDLRTLAPIDDEAVFDSVRKTRRAVVAHEAPRTSGLGSEIAARIGEACFSELDAPVGRVANPDVPLPFAPSLERAALPQVDDIVRAVRNVGA